MGFNAVIFDMDGTLLDTLADLADCMNRVLERSGLPAHPVEAYRLFVGDGMTNLVRRVVPAEHLENLELVSRLRTEMIEEYGRHWAEKTRPYPGVEELLEAVSGRGVRMAILSNKPHLLTARIAAHFFGRFPFTAVLGAREEIPRKPDPQAALEIARRFALAPKEVLYAGDTDTDMQTGRRAGMFTVGVLWGFRSQRELEESGAQRLAASPRELLDLLTG